MEPSKKTLTFAEWKAAHESRRAAYQAASQVWPDWMPVHERTLYKINHWQPPTGKLIQLTGYNQPEAPAGYRMHHQSRWSGTDCYTWYYEPLPQDGAK